MSHLFSYPCDFSITDLITASFSTISSHKFSDSGKKNEMPL